MTPTPATSTDCHAHIIDPRRFPLPAGGGYKPLADECGTREEFCAVLDRHGVRNGLLVQLSGYGTDNRPLLDAIAAYPGRFKAIAVIDAGFGDRQLEDLARGGVVGVRFNLPSYDPQALLRPDAPRLLQRIKALGWFAQVYADDRQWQEAAPILKASGVKVLVDHFGVRDVDGGPAQKGFAAVLALGRDGRAAVKFSSPFRVSPRMGDYAEIDPYAERLVAAFPRERIVWGSDWPFTNVPKRPAYAETVAPLARWFPDPGDRARILSANPRNLFGFKD
ncbi:MAG: amidohydrolase family protein [Alphaproteobacteria bacterium]|nr:amidohydrolase family protein [Alphaproteobacteria bacterium]